MTLIQKGTKLRRDSSINREVTVISGPHEDDCFDGGNYYIVEFPSSEPYSQNPTMDLASACIGEGREWEVIL